MFCLKCTFVLNRFFCCRYKDGRPYPWPATVSQLILYPESANQTVYTQTIGVDDAGNYTCLLKNDSVVHSHTIHLKVFGEYNPVYYQKSKRTKHFNRLDIKMQRFDVFFL